MTDHEAVLLDAIATVKFLTDAMTKDPGVYLDALRDAVFDLEDAYNAYVDIEKTKGSQ